MYWWAYVYMPCKDLMQDCRVPVMALILLHVNATHKNQWEFLGVVEYRRKQIRQTGYYCPLLAFQCRLSVMHSMLIASITIPNGWSYYWGLCLSLSLFPLLGWDNVRVSSYLAGWPGQVMVIIGSEQYHLPFIYTIMYAWSHEVCMLGGIAIMPSGYGQLSTGQSVCQPVHGTRVWAFRAVRLAPIWRCLD